MRRLPFHPVAFAAFPLLFLYAQNAERVRIGKLLGPLVIAVGLTLAVGALAALVFRSVRRGAIVASGAALLGLSYGHVRNAFEGDAVAGVVVGRDLFLLPLWGLLAVAIVWLAWKVRTISETTAVANAICIGLIAVAFWSTVSAAMAVTGPVQTRPGEDSEPMPATSDQGTERDIYYLVFDRYGSERVLERYLGIDNSAFVEALRDRGFAVADESRSNYPTTAHSLASSLNMTYLNDLAEDVGADSPGWRPIHDEIVGPRVSRFLQEQGYRYAHIGPWYDPTAHDPTANLNFHYDQRTEFTRVWLETTIVQPLAKRFGFLGALDGRRYAHNQVRFQLDSILEAARLDGPTFTFAHLLVPHSPHTFAADGRYVDEQEGVRSGYEAGYEGQLRFLNSRILEIVDQLLDVPEDEQPIIVLQADEGPKRPDWTYGDERPWTEANATELDLKFGILNATFLPGTADVGLYPSISSVNTFRVIFDAYYDTELGLLEDRQYVYESGDKPYRLTDVTDRLASVAP